jgi:hypothetical protein
MQYMSIQGTPLQFRGTTLQIRAVVKKACMSHNYILQFYMHDFIVAVNGELLKVTMERVPDFLGNWSVALRNWVGLPPVDCISLYSSYLEHLALERALGQWSSDGA